MSLQRVAIIVLVSCVAVAAAYALALAWFDGPRIADTVESRLSDRYGLSLSAAEVRRSYSLRPRIEASDLEIENDSFEGETLIAADAVAFTVRPWTFLFGPVTLDDLDVEGLRVRVPTTGGGGAPSWDPLVEMVARWFDRFRLAVTSFDAVDAEAHFGPAGDKDGIRISVGELRGELPRAADFRFEASDVSSELSIDRLVSFKVDLDLSRFELRRQDGPLPVLLVASGKLNDTALSFDAAGGNLLSPDRRLREPVRARLTYGEAKAEIAGTMSADDERHLALGLVWNDPGGEGGEPVFVTTAIDDRGANWHFDKIRFARGDRQASGSVLIEALDDGRRVSGEADLSGFGSDEAEDADEPEADESRDGDEPGRLRQLLFADDLLSRTLDYLRSLEVDYRVGLRGSRVMAVPFDSLDLKVTASSGALAATVEQSEAGGANLTGSLALSEAGDQPAVELSGQLRDVEVARLLRPVEKLKGIEGRFDGEFSLKGSGADLSAALGSAEGYTRLYLDEGSMPNKLAETIAGEVITALMSSFDEKDKTSIRCAKVGFKIEDGVANSEALLMDTGDFYMKGKGHIDLSDGSIDLRLTPRARDFSLISVRTPYRIRGRLDDIRFDVDVSESMESLLTPIEFGSDRDTVCDESNLSFDSR